MGPIEKVYEKPPEGEPIKPDEEMMVGDDDTPMDAEIWRMPAIKQPHL